MKIYRYNMKGIFVKESDARLDPLESKKQKKDIFLVPANATDKKPPSASENEVAVFSDKKWSIVEDYRGLAYHVTDGSHHLVMTDIGPLPDGAVLGVNQDAIDQEAEEAAAVVDAAWEAFDSATTIASLKIALKKLLGR